MITAASRLAIRSSPAVRGVIDLVLPAPHSAGNYQLEFDMVSEHVTWFEDVGSTIPLAHSIQVQ